MYKKSLLAPIALMTTLAVGCDGPPLSETGSYRLRFSAQVDHLANVAIREPMVVEHPGGALFVAGYTQDPTEFGRSPKLFKSLDSGSTWTRVDVGTPAQGAIGNSDVDLAVGPDGTLYFLTMGFDRSTSQGTHVTVGVSHNIGESWRWNFVSEEAFDDRPWIVVTPRDTAHIVWNDGNGVSHAVSTDTGHSWSERTRIHPQGGSSHVAVGPLGEIAVRITPLSASGNRFHDGVDLLAVSADGGATWEKRIPPGNRTWTEEFANSDGVTRWVEPVAWDQAGSLYHLWSEGSELWLARSSNGGQTWGSWLVVTSDAALYFPYLVARGEGELAASWYSGTGDSLRIHVATIDLEGDDQPTLGRTNPLTIDSWRVTESSSVRDTGGEYVPVVFLSDGDIGLVTPIQNATANRLGFTWHRISR